MQQLNAGTTKIFARLIELLGTKESIAFATPDSMDFEIEKLEAVDFNGENGSLYQLTQKFLEGGKLLHSPQMVFITIDKRKGRRDIESLFVYPSYLKDDVLGVDEESIRIHKGEVVHSYPLWQKGHCRQASVWLNTLDKIGVFKRPKH